MAGSRVAPNVMPEVTVDAVRASAYVIPTDAPEADGTLQWDATTFVLAEVDAGGRTGTGYTYAHDSCVRLIEGMLAGAVEGRDAMDVPGAWAAMQRSIRNLGRAGLVSCAMSAVETALYDAKARLLDLPLSWLLGRVRESCPLYGSGGFTIYDEEQTRAQLTRWVHEQHIPRVKIKIGESWGTEVARDLARVALAREVVGEDVAVYVDANGGYSVGQAVRVGHALADHGVTWFEEPVSSDDPAGLAKVSRAIEPDVAAGEYGFDLPHFRCLLDAEAVDCLQIDVTRCGGIDEWLRVAALATAHNRETSAHTAPNLSAHVAVATPGLRHLEYFHDHERIENMLFDGTLWPVGGALRPDVSAPGHGLTFKRSDALPYRVA